MANIRPKFAKQEFNTVLRELCCDARQRIWKKSSETEFLINGKIYKNKKKKENFINNEPTLSNQGSNSSQNSVQNIQQSFANNFDQIGRN